MVTVQMFNDAKGVTETVVVPDALAQEIVAMIFGGQVWKTLIQGAALEPYVIDQLRHKHKRWYAAMREAMQTPPTEDQVLARAQSLREAGQPWREVARETGLSVTTLRRKLAA